MSKRGKILKELKESLDFIVQGRKLVIEALERINALNQEDSAWIIKKLVKYPGFNDLKNTGESLDKMSETHNMAPFNRPLVDKTEDDDLPF